MSSLAILDAPVLDLPDLLNRLSTHDGAYLLDSGGSHPLARFTLAGALPEERLRIQSGRAILQGASRAEEGEPWAALQRVFGPTHSPAPAWPLARWVGFLAYELGALCDRFPALQAPSPVPDALFSRHRAGYVLDRLAGHAWIWGESSQDARSLQSLLCRPLPLPAPPRGRLALPAEELETRAEHAARIRRALEYIGAGDIYQANLTRRYRARLLAPPWALYEALRAQSPAPFGAYLDCGDLHVCSVSPERFLRYDPGSRRLETRPIKGTRPRFGRAAADAAAARELAASPKDLAEHVMIVDLARNDLGRVCRAGTVRAARLAALESFAHVHHLVSTVEGELAPGRDFTSALRAAFPGGSITGAPKVRAMEIIAELERAPRGVSFGAFGHADAAGGADLALAIRTAVVRAGYAAYAAGGGIVADSQPDLEVDEADLKARAFLHALSGPRAPREQSSVSFDPSGAIC